MMILSAQQPQKTLLLRQYGKQSCSWRSKPLLLCQQLFRILALQKYMPCKQGSLLHMPCSLIPTHLIAGQQKNIFHSIFCKMLSAKQEQFRFLFIRAINCVPNNKLPLHCFRRFAYSMKIFCEYMLLFLNHFIFVKLSFNLIRDLRQSWKDIPLNPAVSSLKCRKTMIILEIPIETMKEYGYNNRSPIEKNKIAFVE